MNDLIVGFPQLSSDSSTLPPTPVPVLIESRRVSFSEYSQMVIIEKLSDEYKSDLWYRDNEIKVFKIECAYDAHVLRSSSSKSKISPHDVMGLEHIFDRRLIQRRRDIQAAVLKEQLRQRVCKINDPDTLAMISARESAPSRKRAQLVGLVHYQC